MYNELLVARLRAAADAMSDCAQTSLPTAALMREAASVIGAIPLPKPTRGFKVPGSVLLDAVTEGLTLANDIILEVDLAGRITVTLPSGVNDVLKRICPKPAEA